MNIDSFIDIVLAASVITLAVLSLAAQRLFTSIVLYINLGLLITLIWVRLKAWDVAIAEAAIGAGLTGALFFVALRQLRTTSVNNEEVS